MKPPLLTDNKGNFLIGLMIFISIIAIIAATASRTLLHEKSRVNREYYEVVALYAAESCIELAKSEMFSSASSHAPGGGREFSFGSEYFSQIPGKDIDCLVNAYVHGDRVFMDSSARVTLRQNMASKGGRQVIAERTVKAALTASGPPLKISTLWQVSGPRY